MRHTINLDCKTTHVAKDGTFPVLLRVSINGEHSYFNIGRRIKDAHYDRQTKSVKSGINGYTSIKSYIDRHYQRIDAIINDFDKKGEIATLQKVKEIYERKEGNTDESKCFYDFVTKRILEERAEGEITNETLDNYDSQITWEQKYLKAADLLVFWVPRELTHMPAFTTNIEFGMYIMSDKDLIYGRPADSPKNKYLDFSYEKYRNKKPYNNILDMTYDITYNYIIPNNESFY